ncbi:unnamed protein product [Owenia fusiformis]|uniref:Glycine N-acyltransferase-like protein n=1 Tax=Owenia fusiformis TaxID=6347 RepID=A0A8J1UBD9_OWEFU|nr:unnamed protein product [Owenia fusiformis]
MVLKLLRSQLPAALLTLKTKAPQSQHMCGLIQAELFAGLEWFNFVVDKWPDFTCIAATPEEWLIKKIPNIDDNVRVSVFSHGSDAVTTTFLQQCGINFQNKICFSAIEENIIRCIKNMTPTQGTIRVTEPCFMFGVHNKVSNMSKDIESNGVIVDELRESDVDYVNATWTFGGNVHTRAFISNLVESFPTSCIRDKETHSIYAHMMLSSDLSMGMLHVEESKRRLGYGSTVINNLAAKVIQIGGIPFWYVVTDNLTSTAMSKRNGRTLCDDIFSWATYLPHKSNEEKFN